jgi:hypothetical protein
MTAESQAGRSAQISTGGIVGIVVGISAFLALLAGLFLLYHKKMRSRRHDQFSMIDLSAINTDATKNSILNYEDIKSLNLVGQGNFGVVYRYFPRNFRQNENSRMKVRLGEEQKSQSNRSEQST